MSNVSASLSSSKRNACEGFLSVEECFTALQGMARRKAPGSDGLRMEFYLKFWSLLGPDLVRVLNSCFSAGRLSHSQCRGIISLSFVLYFSPQCGLQDCLSCHCWQALKGFVLCCG